MKQALFCLLLLTALGGWSCSAVSISVDYDHDTDFTQYKTFRWLPQDQRAPDKMAAERSFFEKRL